MKILYDTTIVPAIFSSSITITTSTTTTITTTTTTTTSSAITNTKIHHMQMPPDGAQAARLRQVAERLGQAAAGGTYGMRRVLYELLPL